MANDPTVLIEVKLKDLFTQEFKKVQGEVAKFDQAVAPAVDKAASRFAGLGSAMRNAFGMMAGYATIRGIDNAVNSFARLDSARKTFEMLGADIGDTQDAVKQWSDTLRGTVDETAILQAANSALTSGLVKTKEQFDALSKAAYVLSRASGDTVTQSLDTLTQGLASGNPRALAKLGIDLQEQFSDEQERFGRELKREEKQHLMINAMMGVTSDQYDKLSGQAVTLNEKLQQSTVAWGDIEESIGEATKVFADFKLKMAEGLLQTIDYWKQLGDAIGAAMGGVGVAFGGGGVRRVPKGGNYWPEVDPRVAQNLSADGKPSLFAGIMNPLDIRREYERQQKQAGKAAIPAATAAAADSFTFGGGMRPEHWRTAADDAADYLGRLDTARQKSMLLSESNARLSVGFDKMWKSAKLGVMSYSNSIGTATDMIADAVQSSLQAVESSLEDVLVDSMMGKMKSFKEYMLSLVEDISRAIAKLMVRMMIMKPLMGALESGTGIDFGMGSEKPVGLAAGGVTYGRQLAMVSETGPEAHVPLVGGRSIPVEIAGGGGGRVEQHFHFGAGSDAQGIRRLIHQEKDYFFALAREANRTDPATRSSIRRIR